MNKISFLSNAGVMLELHDKKILIDSFCNSTIPIYKNLPVEVGEQIITGTTPYDNINGLLFTHDHSDHFDPVNTVRFLKEQKKAFVISTSEVISQLNNQLSNTESSRLIKLDIYQGGVTNFQTGGIEIQAISMLHDGSEYDNVTNLAFLVIYNEVKILHLGDAKPIAENYLNLNLADLNIDLLITPFPYIGLTKGRQIIEEYIKPKKIAAVHLPQRELDHYGWIESTLRNYIRVKNDFIDTVFWEKTGEFVII